MNGLYGSAMCDFLPFNILGFSEKYTLEEILNTPDNNKIGYFVEVDIKIPKSLHNYLKDYPPCPENMNIKTEWLSDYQKNIYKINNSKHNETSKKLILNLFDKNKYICHYTYLKYIHSLGLEISNLHRVLEFEQSDWMKPYIEMNMNLRMKSKNKFEENFFKLMNNAVYGKTMENVLQYENFEIIKDEKKTIKRISKDNFKHCELIDGMYFIRSSREKVLYSKPCYIGSAVLDISKVKMLNFHYGFMKKYDNDLLYSDTDSLIYHIKTEDFYKEMHDNKELFDLAKINIEEFKNIENYKINGKMKDETSMKPIIEFVSLCPKVYSYITEEKNEKRNKGINTCVIKELKHDNYKSVLEDNINIKKEQFNIHP